MSKQLKINPGEDLSLANISPVGMSRGKQKMTPVIGYTKYIVVM